MTEPTIVAHRGLSALYPENTSLALEQAILCGAKAVEFDVQLTADQIPVLFHDKGMRRLCGRIGNLLGKRWQDLQKFSAHYPRRFGRCYAGTAILSLESCVQLLLNYPDVLVCVELKTESVDRFGVGNVVDRVLRLTEPLAGRVQYLSFSYEVIEYLQKFGVRQTNWVLKQCNDTVYEAAQTLAPAVLACSLKRLPQVLWPGPWDWMVYETQDPLEVKRLFDFGVRYVESDNVQLLAKALPEYFNVDQRNG